MKSACSGMCKMFRSRSFCTCANYSGLCSPLIHSVVSKPRIRLRGCIHCPHMREDKFWHGTVHIIANIVCCVSPALYGLGILPIYIFKTVLSRLIKFIFSSPGLCPWRAYVVTLALASASASTSASALAQCLSFQKCA